MLYRPNLPSSYGGLTRAMLIQASSLSKVQTCLVFDDYLEPSIKDAERARRGAVAADAKTYMIAGPLQRLPEI